MRFRSAVGALAVVAAGVIVPAPCHATHHLWRLTQVFSNASGTVQFVQLNNNTTDTTETQVAGFTLTTSSGHTFTFGANLSGSTANKWILLATSGFASVPGGVTPDYVIPADFLPTGGGSLTYAGGTDTWSFGAVPTDGVHSLMRDGTTPTNSVINFAGQTGSVNLASPVPALPRWGIVVLVGALLVASSGLLRSRDRRPWTTRA
jgi:hypothetical protein